MKTLQTIQTIAKVGKVLSIIAFVGSMIGVIGTAVGIIGLATLGEKFIEMGGDTVQEELSIPTMLAAMSAGAVFCIGTAIVSKLAQKYFTNELADGTPFTLRGAKELMRLGAVNMIVSVVASMLANGGVNVAAQFISDIDLSKIGMDDAMSGNFGLGIVLMIVALICRYGAELTEGKAEAAPAEAPEEMAAPAVDE